VQIGDAIQEKKVLDTIIEARDKCLYSAITIAAQAGCPAPSEKWARTWAPRYTWIRCR